MGLLKQAAKRQRPVSETDNAHEPLLPHHDYQRSSHAASTRSSGPTRPPAAAPPVDLGWQLLCRLWRILLAVNAAPALSLLLLSIMEAIIISKIGTISGLFYQVFVDGERSKVLHLMLWSSACYTATALFYAVKVSLQDIFAWRWRASLTCRLQQAYCSNLAFYSLKGIDNPDQRLAQDLPLLTSTLAETLSVLAAAPFNVFWYTRLTHQVFGSWCPVAAAYLFFVAGAIIQRVVMLPVASTVFQQEAAEGSYRYKQMRLRTLAEEIALYGGAQLEHTQLTLQLSQVLACQGKLLLRRAVLTTATKLLEYGGLIVNFGCLAMAVFSGAWDSDRSSAGGIAAKVSVASFYLLTLIYSFTQVLDLASKVSNLAGLTARVSQLWEQLELIQQQQQQDTSQQYHKQHQHQQQEQSISCNFGSCPSSSHLGPQTPHQAPARTSHEIEYQQQQRSGEQQQHQCPQALHLLGDYGAAFSHKRFASQAVMLQAPQLVGLATALEAADVIALPGAQQQQQQHGQQGVQCSTAAHALTIDINSEGASSASHTAQQQQQEWQQIQISKPQQQQQQQQQQLMQISVHSLGSDVLLHEVRRAFPDCPRLAPLTAVVTFQFCGAAQQIMLQQWQQQGVGSQQQRQRQAEGQCQQSLYAAAAAAAVWTSAAAECDPATSSSGSSDAHESPVGQSCGQDDMARMLQVFLRWQQQVHGCITSRGYWCDAIDPRTGHALHSAAGCAYDEVIGAQVLLGYHTQHDGDFTLICHPLAGTQVYPATLFTSAPLPVLREALAAAAAATARGTSGSSTSSSHTTSHSTPAAEPQNMHTEVKQSGSAAAGAAAARVTSPRRAAFSRNGSSIPAKQQQRPATPAPARALATTTALTTPFVPQMSLLTCEGLTVRTPNGVLIVRDLNLSLTAAAGSAATARPAANSEASVVSGPSAGWMHDVSRSGSSSKVTACLLIQGPSGCGKSTLLKCLAGLWRAEAGRFSLVGAAAAAADPISHEFDNTDHTCSNQASSASTEAAAHSSSYAAGVGTDNSGWDSSRPAVMFSPQKVLAAPGRTLRDQLVYPAAASSFACCCCHSMNSSGSQKHRHRQHHSKSRKGSITASSDLVVSIQQQQQQQPLKLDWWQTWLTCGVLQQEKHREHITAFSRPENPKPNPCLSCQLLLTVLQQVGLGYLLDSFPAGLHTANEDWGAVLSPGEMQRLAFARVLLHRPVLAVLDEGTSALPDDVAVEVYQQLQQCGISYVSVGHSSRLEVVHDHVLRIAGDGAGSWQLCELTQQ